MALPSKVVVSEVVTRDGFQAEAQFIPTSAKAELIGAFMACGVRRLEATSFVSPRAVPQLADAEALMAALPRPRPARLAGLVANARGALRAVDAGVDEIVAIVSASESHNRSNLNASIGETLGHMEGIARIGSDADVDVHGGIAVAFGCPFEGEVPIPRVVGIISRMKELGIRGATLGDTTGMATPPLVEALVGELRTAHPDFELTLHFHNTRGIGLVNIMSALQAGIERFEATCGGLGGCPFAPGASGNVCTEDLVYLLHELGIETGIDLDQLLGIAGRIEQLVGRPLPGQVMRAGPRLRLHPLDGAPRAVG